MRSVARWAGVLVFLAAMPSHAATLDPFPDQPGALTSEEIQAATVVMNSARGAEPAPPLVASGKRSPGHSMPAYALFAAPLEDYSGRIRTRRQIICNLFGGPPGQWNCSSPHDEMRMSANGLEHVFLFQVVKAPGNKQTAADIVDFMYSSCFFSQLTALGGNPFTPSADADYVSTVLDDGAGFTVATGPLSDGDNYRLQKAQQGDAGCRFRIQHARMARTGLVIPESYARELAKAAREAEAQRKLAQAQQEEAAQVGSASVGEPVSQLRRGFDKLTDATVAFNSFMGIAALIAPFAALSRGRKAAARIAFALSGATVVLAAAVLLFLKLASMPDTGNCMLLVIPVTSLAALSGVIWAVIGAMAAGRPGAPR